MASTTQDDNAPTLPDIPDEALVAVASGLHTGPHSVLGQHPVHEEGGSGDLVVVRAFRPLARQVVAVLDTGVRVDLAHLAHGVWQGWHTEGLQDYVLEASYDDGGTWTTDDPYRYLPSFGEVDSFLFGEGRHERLWHVLGAHVREHWGVNRATRGTAFAVWAPHARAVRVVGDFNGWDGVQHTMRRLDSNGVWELFVPGLDSGTYKFDILTQAGDWVRKADPMARFTEVPPRTASVIGESHYEWGDGDWLTARAERDPHNSPMSVYEMHAGSWRPGLGYRELADELIPYLTELGYTHVEFLPLAEHPFGGSWGYQVTSYYAPTSRFGHPNDLKYLIDRLHQAGIGVLVDWVPAHFPKDEWALAKFDGQPLYEHTDPRRGEQMDWGTLVFDFGHSQVRNFLVANALYWMEEFHVDGLRVDAVASMLYLDYSREDGQWLPNRFGGRENLEAIGLLQEVNATVYKTFPGVVMIAEESTSWPGVTRPTSGDGLGFGLKWNMGWMHDSLQYMQTDPMYRSYHHGEITFSFVYANSENFLLPISHDEVVHGKGSLFGKMPGDHWQKLANLRAYLSFMWAHPGKQLLFMGQEFAQPSEWSEERGLDWWILDQPVHRGIHSLVGHLNRAYVENPPLWQRDNEAGGFDWLNDSSELNVVSFLRWDRDGNPIAVLHNFSGQPVSDYRVGLPFAGTWDEIVNTDAEAYGGSGVGNFGSVEAVEGEYSGRPASATLTLPPLAGLWLKLRRDERADALLAEQAAAAVEAPVELPVDVDAAEAQAAAEQRSAEAHGETVPAETPAGETAPAATAPTESAETPEAKPKRTRTPRAKSAAKGAAAAVGAAVVGAAAVGVAAVGAAVAGASGDGAEADAADTPPAKPTRTRTSRAKSAAAEAPVDGTAAEATPVKPTRTRTSRAKSATGTPVDAVANATAADATPVKPTRTRTSRAKSAAGTAVDAAATDAPAEKPARTRTTRSKAAAPKSAEAEGTSPEE
ncbi:1,4-alpha-glucan branching protein GlgB [Planctomonas deserti]|uniref:1,4-alpha-glucan branching protein GlgB n=1 Tax=Planctomonas deserti TaxID=2144185 RepID=UPI00131F3513|nr:1,4-alpha-glucan branching protein GlgB [Planctomonas deserti]